MVGLFLGSLDSFVQFFPNLSDNLLNIEHHFPIRRFLSHFREHCHDLKIYRDGIDLLTVFAFNVSEPINPKSILDVNLELLQWSSTRGVIQL